MGFALGVIAGGNPLAEFIVVIGVGQADGFPSGVVEVDFDGIGVVILKEFPVGVEVEIDAVAGGWRVGIGPEADADKAECEKEKYSTCHGATIA